MVKRVLFTAFLLIVCTSVFAQEKPIPKSVTLARNRIKSANIDRDGNLYIETFSIPNFLITDIKNVTTTIDEKLDGTYVWVEFSISTDGTRHYADYYGEKAQVPLASRAIIFTRNLSVRLRWDEAIDAALQKQGRRGSDVFPTVERW